MNDVIANENKSLCVYSNLVDNKSLECFYEYKDLKEVPYFATKDWVKLGCHHGQRKLLLSEIQFLSAYGRECDIVIYVGSAPCSHLPVLLKLFPHIKFLLIDPNYHKIADFVYVYQNVDCIKSPISNNRIAPFYKRSNLYDISGLDDVDMDDILCDFEQYNYETLIADILAQNNRVYIIQDFMTIKLAQLIHKSIDAVDNPKICVMSDMRTNHDVYPTDVDYVWNSAINIAFISILNPDNSMLKFHPPYFSEEWPDTIPDYIANDLEYIKSTYGLDYINQYKQKKHYFFDGSKIWLQAWGPPSSSEARMVVKKDDISRDYVNYDPGIWDDKFMYLRLVRQHGFFPNYTHNYSDRDNNYDNCFDCSLELSILCMYHQYRHNIDSSLELSSLWNNMESRVHILSYIDIINSVLSNRVMLVPHHGFITKPLSGLKLFKVDRTKKSICVVKINPSGYVVRSHVSPNNEIIRISDNSPTMVKYLKKILNKERHIVI